MRYRLRKAVRVGAAKGVFLPANPENPISGIVPRHIVIDMNLPF